EVHINELKALEHGQLNIGASDTLCHHYLLPYLQSFHQKYPHVNLKVTNRTSKETVELLRSGKVDIGFINMPTDIGENLEFKTLEVLHDCFVFNEKFFSVSSLSDILSLPILMLEKDSSTRRYTDSYFKTIGVNLNPQIELGSHELLLSFAKIGLGVAAVVREYSAEYIKSGILKEVNLKNSIPPRSIALVFHSKIPLSLSAKEFVKFFK
ncbi:MAG: LysR family transcriptional regulator substrate-binding protein, partial [Clostridia bacterium]